MNTKDKVQNKMEDLRRQIEELKERREVLQADSAKIAAGLESRTQIISEALVAGQDANKETEFLASDKAKLENLSHAIALINGKIMDLDRQYAGATEAFWKEDLDRLAAETDGLLDAGIKKLYAAVDDLKKVEAKYKEYDLVAGKIGQRVDNSEHLRDVRRIYRYLLGDSGNSQGAPSQIGITFKLGILEKRHGSLLAQLRGKK